jgi:phage terminase small subunit
VKPAARKGLTLDLRSRLAIENVLSGKSRTDALRSAGYSPSYATRRAGWFFARSEVKAALEAGWDAIRKDSVYTATKAMQECEEAMAFAKANKNAMAFCKVVELRARLSGLLQDVLRVEVVDVRSAIAEANARRTLPWNQYRQIPVSNNNPFED